MMKRHIFLLIAAVLFATSSCTHNNGDIGPLFGQWHLESITSNGEPVADYDGNIFFRFQSSVVCILTIDDYHAGTQHWGTWEEAADGKAIILNYTYTADVAHNFELPAVLGLSNSTDWLNVITLTGSDLILTYTPDDATTLRYTLRKQ